VSRLLLLSGGLDSAAIAGIDRPEAAVFVDYGQYPARSELASARMVALYLSLVLHEISVDFSQLGTGLLVGQPKTGDAPTPEWFPFRNQFLVTIAAAMALRHGHETVVLGVVGGDGDRHADGTRAFVNRMDALISSQEGGVRVAAPYVGTSARNLIARTTLPEHVLRRTHSCHVGNLACGQCPGCHRRATLLAGLREG
jgi:7-cyano-7-deazaguanine synthase